VHEHVATPRHHAAAEPANSNPKRVGGPACGEVGVGYHTDPGSNCSRDPRYLVSLKAHADDYRDPFRDRPELPLDERAPTYLYKCLASAESKAASGARR